MGVDRSETVIAELSACGGNGPPGRVPVADAYDLPFPDPALDGCRADRVFHHLEDPRQAWADPLRMARPGGRVLLFDPDFETAIVEALDRALRRRLLNASCNGFQDGWMERRLPGLLRQAGLTEIAVEPVTVLLTDRAQANAVLALEKTATRARAEGVGTESAGTAWRDGPRATSEAGRFFAAITGFIAAGRKP